MELTDEEKKNLETAKKVAQNVVNAVSSAANAKVESAEKEAETVAKHTGVDTNGNGVLDDDELTPEQLAEKEKSKKSQKDIRKLFYFVYAFTFIVMIAKFVSYFFFETLIEIDISKLANTLNVAIVFIGCAEGIRSFTNTLGDADGVNPVPAYKLKFLFGYLIAFAIISMVAIVFEFFSKACANDGETVPEFSVNDFTSGLLSNTLAYLIARYGSKVAEGIDLSSLTWFKKKI